MQMQVQAPAPQRVLHLSVRLVLVWSVLCALAIGLGRQALVPALPLFDRVIDMVQDDFVATVEIAQDQGTWVLRIQPLLVRPVTLSAELAMPPGTRLRWFVTHVDHTLVPPLLFLMALLTWPATRRRELAARLLLAVPVLLLILTLTAPILLVGQVEMVTADLAVLAGAPRREPPLVTLMVFMESGGGWLLPLAGGVLCIALGRRLQGAKNELRGFAGGPAVNGASSS
jgi:hypothetical protein